MTDSTTIYINYLNFKPMTDEKFIHDAVEYGVVDADSPMETRTCKDCGEIKFITEFRRSRHSPDGYSNVCKSCAKKKYRDTLTAHNKSVGVNEALAGFTARELLDELKARGYSGKLYYTQVKEVVM